MPNFVVMAKNPRPASISLPWYRKARPVALFIFLCGCLLYANTFGHDYALDDAIVITRNAFTQEGISGLGDIFRYDTFRGFYQDDRGVSLVAGGRYRPLTLAMFAVEHSLGMGATGHHILNAVWYGLLCVVLFGLIRDLTRQRDDLPWWLAAGVALLFAAHPLHTEAVANIKGRDEIVAALGAFAATWLVWRAAHHQQWWSAIAGAGVFLLGCLAKENAITFLVVVPAVLWWFGPQGGVGDRLRYALPLVGAAALFLALRFAIVGTGTGSGPVMELLNNPFLELRDGSWQPLSTADRLATVMDSLWRYLVLLVAPVGLVHDYYPRAIPIMYWHNLTPWLGLSLHLAMGFFVLLRWRRFPLISLGLLVYLAALSIVSNVFFSVGTNMSERFLFLPSGGFVLAATTAIARLAHRYAARIAWLVPGVIVLFAALTVWRNPAWKDDYTLFTTDLARQPNSVKLLTAASGARLDRYAARRNAGENPGPGPVQTALRDLGRAVAIHPTYRLAYELRGNGHFYLEDYDAAIADYDRAFDLSGGDAAAAQALVIALNAAAEAGGKGGKPLAEVMAYLRRAQQLAPNDYETLRLLGVAHGMNAQPQEALRYFNRALQQRPDDADAHWNYGIALYQAGRPAEAEQQFARAEELQPGIRADRQ